MTDYNLLCAQLKALTDGVPHPISNLSNAAALLFHTLVDVNWAGFYLLENETLVLGPFQGKPACIEIPIGKGVCGTAVSRGEPLVVDDVHSFAGHIACDSDSRSEIVIPLRRDGRIIGVLDIDSPLPARFSASDAIGLQAFVHILEKAIGRSLPY